MSTWGDMCRRAEGKEMRKEEEAIEKERIRKQLEVENIFNKFKDKVYYKDEDGSIILNGKYYVLDYPGRIKEDYGSYINPDYVTWFK